MTTFSKINSESNGADPAVVNMNAVGSTDNALFAMLSDRSGTASSNHTVTDANGTWTALVRRDILLTNSTARHTLSVWFRKAVSADTSAAFDVTGDDGTANTKRLSVIEINPSAPFDWTFDNLAIADSGTGSTSPQGSGNTTASGVADNFLMSFASWRTSSNTLTLITFTNTDTDQTEHLGGADARNHAFEIIGTGKASGVESTSCDWSGSGHENVVGILVFTDGAGGAATPYPTALLLSGVG